MKAVQFERFGDPDVLRYVDVPDPVPRGDEVLIAVAAAGASYVDVRQRQGVYNRAETHVGGVRFPYVTGSQAVGRVVAVGEDVDAALVGRKVVAVVPNGAYAERLVAPARFCAVVPDDADDATLAVIPMQGLTAYCMLTASTVLKPGESILVHAAGSGVGNLAVQIARILGAHPIVATAATAEKRDLARAAGADVVVDYTAPDWTGQVLDATGGKGVDVLLESIGGAVFEQNFDCLATFGRYILFGSTQAPPTAFEPRRLMTRSQSLTGIYVPVFYTVPDRVGEALRFMVEHVAKGDLRARIGKALPLAEAATAHRLLEDRQVVGSILLHP